MSDQRTLHLMTRGLWQVYSPSYDDIIPSIPLVTRGLQIQQPPPPSPFKKHNVDQDPSPKVTIEWGIPTGFAPIGFRVYRAALDDFVPSGKVAGEGNCIADESTLGPAATQLTDLNVNQGELWYYKIGFVVEA